MRKSKFIFETLAVASCAALAMLLALVASAQAGGRSLATVEAQVEIDHKSVPQLTSAELAVLMATPGDLALFDVREEDEYAVSHIPTATRVSPSMWASTFLSRYAGAIEGKTVVFYCSVGVRSSRLAARAQSELLRRGAKAVYNLRGGIFRWHNEGRPLATAAGTTHFVHPYDADWGRLVERQHLLRTKPARER